MFVVRIVVNEEKTDFKVFVRRPDAEKRFNDASYHVRDGSLSSAAWFDVRTDDLREAVEAVKQGNRDKISLLGLEEPPKPLEFDLSELGL